MFNPSRRTILGLSLGLSLILLAALVACAPPVDTDREPGDPIVETAPTEQVEMMGEIDIIMRNSTYNPAEITVAPGTTVTWKNEDGYDHTVTAGTRTDPTGEFDETVPPGGSFSYTFEQPGEHPYFCTLHADMTGVIFVGE